MYGNTARQYEQEDTRATPRVPAQVIPLRPAVGTQGRAQERSVTTQERIAEVVLAVVTIGLSGLLFLALYNGLQNYRVF
jgi:hypothetical protein